MKNNLKGPKAGWIFGGIGSIIWMPVLGIVLLLQDNYIGLLATCAFFILSIIYLIIFAPWKHRDVSLGLLYSGISILIILAGVTIFIIWIPAEMLSHIIQKISIYILILILIMIIFPLLLPIFILKNKTWEDVSPE